MTRDDLIERHAQEVFAAIGNKGSDLTACRAFARRNIDDFWPLFVEFVAEWLTRKHLHPMADVLWREDMT